MSPAARTRRQPISAWTRGSRIVAWTRGSPVAAWTRRGRPAAAWTRRSWPAAEGFVVPRPRRGSCENVWICAPALPLALLSPEWTAAIPQRPLRLEVSGARSVSSAHRVDSIVGATTAQEEGKSKRPKMVAQIVPPPPLTAPQKPPQGDSRTMKIPGTFDRQRTGSFLFFAHVVVLELPSIII
jgi:hypothetical protein